MPPTQTDLLDGQSSPSQAEVIRLVPDPVVPSTQPISITTIVVRRAQHWDIIDPSGCTPEIVDNAITALKNEIRDIHKASHDKRQVYLLASANISKDTDDKQKAHILRKMMKTERRREAN